MDLDADVCMYACIYMFMSVYSYECMHHIELLAFGTLVIAKFEFARIVKHKFYTMQSLQLLERTDHHSRRFHGILVNCCYLFDGLLRSYDLNRSIISNSYSCFLKNFPED